MTCFGLEDKVFVKKLCSELHVVFVQLRNGQLTRQLIGGQKLRIATQFPNNSNGCQFSMLDLSYFEDPFFCFFRTVVQAPA